jgi:hypothetical protein
VRQRAGVGAALRPGCQGLRQRSSLNVRLGPGFPVASLRDLGRIASSRHCFTA